MDDVEGGKERKVTKASLSDIEDVTGTDVVKIGRSMERLCLRFHSASLEDRKL